MPKKYKVYAQGIKHGCYSKIIIRNVLTVVRIPFFQMPLSPEDYFYSLLLQYVPFYSEDELIDEHNNTWEAFLAQLRQTNAHLKTYHARDRQLEIESMCLFKYNL